MEAVAHTLRKLKPRSFEVIDLLWLFRLHKNQQTVREFIVFHFNNSHVWEEIKEAVRLAEYFDQKVGIKKIYEDFRHSKKFTRTHGRFKAPNGFTGLYGVLFDEAEHVYFNGPLRKALGLV